LRAAILKDWQNLEFENENVPRIYLFPMTRKLGFCSLFRFQPECSDQRRAGDEEFRISDQEKTSAGDVIVVGV
jgi:hypothetical protein